MRHLLAKLTPIVGGSLRSVLTMERLQAMQDCIHALAEGQNITTTGGLKRGFGVGGLRLDAKRPVMTRGGGGGEYDPWKPTFFTTGTGDAKVYKCRFNLGTVNNVPATNWDGEFTLPDAEDEFRFVLLTITTANGKVSGLNLSVAVSPPTEDVISQDAPPAEHKIVLGAVGRSAAKMIIRQNLQMAGVEVFRESKEAPAVGAEPFLRWWRWQHSVV